ncbi:hypothetical protein M124_2417 [Bacteroides fragilis str. 3988T(B)14]|uniref:Uncharacterized protein n=1 Tax=Bacteroides fragilis str. 3988T(B)14 TaxID=1339315 RepID=A0A015SNK5_BACFG|nr:hypothetical protein M124_2417 [Bacteroides fragilis str. 3988T(B)14]EXY79733.1 hypothetical protein M084_2519 [Bacteroides fragilis str. 3988 T1]
MILNFIFLQSTKLQKRLRQHNKREEKTGEYSSDIPKKL